MPKLFNLKRPFVKKTEEVSNEDIKEVAERMKRIQDAAALMSEHARNCKQLLKDKDTYLKKKESIKVNLLFDNPDDDPKRKKVVEAIKKCDEKLTEEYGEFAKLLTKVSETMNYLRDCKLPQKVGMLKSE